ncbi:NFX1-type zinc finger-containing protein 1 [Microcaecilia unicolor]|uniref:NFX1-type zinc finger-containing protein 1 n=1 Tax=Microcaecilia unicolor TaxID=1415580 RepID=A0A6P7YVI0_9AMPH|nr:NFX1-type zinc finger-containing protein 1 [Microcaecilia unicolor]XP_030067299.1 NFX1-type zinc finger-containing protein 1 [Microcaecilia unicolor]
MDGNPNWRPRQEPQQQHPNANRGPGNYRRHGPRQRSKNRTDNPLGAGQPIRNPRANYNPPPRQEEDRHNALVRNPNQGRRDHGGHVNEGFRGQRNEQDYEGRRRRLENQDVGRNRRPYPQENHHLQQDHAYSRNQGNEQPQQVRRLGYKALEALLDKDPSEVVITLASCPGMKELLSLQSISPGFLELICRVLHKACSSKMDRQNVQHLLGMVKDSIFLKICLPQYVVGMMTDPVPGHRQEYPVHLGNIMSLLQNLVSVFPASSVQETSMLVSILPASMNALRTSGVDISEQIEKNLEKIRTIINHLQAKRREGTLKVDTYTLVNSEANSQEESYRTMTIYPTYNEVHLDEKPFLRPNMLCGKYESTAVYLDTHFRLLREDFIRPLREGILEILQSYEDKSLRKRRFDDIRIYFDTRIITPLCSFAGIVYKVQFDPKPLKFIRWQNSKRLLYGSLVCMSKDNFETFLFATVSNRELEDLKHGFVQLRFNEQSRAQLAEVQPSDSFLMVETTAYFEAYRHVLEGLQEIQDEDIPFQKYIVQCETEVSEPRYLLMGGTYDFTALMENPLENDKKMRQIYKDHVRAQNINILDPREWPSKEALHLDESQMKALQLALTKELAIIQGPPGTGKTFVGLKIAQALLTNDHVWQINLRRFPVLVVCYTNHALDQFLEGIHKFLGSGIVRVGGRSSSEILKQFTLRELRNTRDFRRNIPLHLRRAYMDITRQMKQSEQKLHEGGQHLECSMRGVLQERFLEKYIEPHHWESLTNGRNDELFCYQSGKQSMILEWLGLGVTTFVRNMADNPGAENAAGQQEADEEEEGKDEDELIDIAEEADLIQADRVLEDDEAVKSRKKKENDDMKELANLLLAMELENEGGGGRAEDTTGKNQAEGKWEVHRDQKKKMKQKVKVELRKLNAMTEAELIDIWDLWSLDLNSRWRLYRHWLQLYQSDIRRKILQHEQEHQEAADRLAELRLQEDLLILRESKVVGMTTTGAAKYRQILQKVDPRIVIVEEAAEVLEAHTITTLSKACKHLILIGDHQQLQPSANVYDLAKNFNLEVSLFERLIRVNMPFVRLNYQHRMRPEIARLLTPHIYEELANHPSVLDYEAIKGVSSNLFFVEHEFLEQAVQDGKSHQNQHEAQFVVELCKYFLCQGYKSSQITILTTYTGQLFSLRKLMPAKIFSGVRVHVVDKYQGEENDIILLSLVRSNREEKVGFLQISNRICVALSRAKKGLYCIGNMKMLGRVPLWSKIIHTLRERGQVGRSLMLCCQNHPDTRTLVSKADDFRNVPEGGCSRPCEFRLSCGHVCTRACHPYDSDHMEFQCIKPCQKVLCADGHRCPQLCFEACEECSVLVRKTIPQCGHLQMVPCSIPAEDFCCKEPCQNILRCGHQCSLSCGEECEELCSEEIAAVLKCGHEQKIKCSMKQDLLYGRPVKCKTKCSATLECGHACPGSCYDCFGGRFHEHCKRPCTRLLICSHTCQEPCTNECPPCQRVCQNRCVHSQCKRKCGEKCIPCVEPCEWSCQHYQCSKLCSEPCDRPPCNVPCTKRLECGHPCIGLCGEPCPTKCRVCHHDEITQIFFGNEDEPDARYVQLEDCGHIFEVSGLDYFMNEKESEEEIVIKLKVCPECQTPIRKNLRYGTIINQRLEEIERVKGRILGPASEIECKRLQLRDQLVNVKDIRRSFPIEYHMMEEKLLASDLSLKTLAYLENLIVFYKRLAGLMTTLGKIDVGEREGLRRKVTEIQGWMDKPQHGFTEQELLDLQSEIQRLTLLVELLVRCKMAAGRVNATTQAEITKLQSVLESSKKFTKEDESLVKTKMMELKESLPCSGLGISEEERVMIVRAIGSPQGHWFKCPNNHIYLITECGGAMHKGTCPDCKAEIGGENHTLLSSNRLASEMDGAPHAAWSEMGNNMLNFGDLRRLV